MRSRPGAARNASCPARHAWRLAAALVAPRHRRARSRRAPARTSDADEHDAVKRVGLMHVGTDHVPPSLGRAEGPPRGARLGRGQEHRADLAQPRAGRRRRAGRAFVRAARRRDRRVRGHSRSTPPRRRRAARRNRIPIVFLHPSDPVRDGLVKSLSRPGREPDGGLRRRATSSPSSSSSTSSSCRGCIACSRSSTRPTRRRSGS